MRTQTLSPTPCASRSLDCANGSANPGSSPPWPASGTASTLNQRPSVREETVDRAPGLSVRLKLTLSYTGFLMFAGAVLLAAGYFSLSRGVHPGVVFLVRSHADLLRNFAPIAAAVLAFLLVFGLVGGWFLAGRMLAPLARITDATRIAATGSLVHRIRLLRCGLVQLRPCHRAAPILAGHQSDDGFVVLDALAGRVSGRMSADLLVEHCQHRSSVHRSAEP